MSWIVVGDTDRNEDCLVCVGFNTEEDANKFATKLSDSPEMQKKYNVEDHRNFRARYTTPEKEWWNDPFLAN